MSKFTWAVLLWVGTCAGALIGATLAGVGLDVPDYAMGAAVGIYAGRRLM